MLEPILEQCRRQNEKKPLWKTPVHSNLEIIGRLSLDTLGPLQLLIFQLSFELLRFCNFSNRFVEVVLVDSLPEVPDRK